jgi:hypothetical protein
MNDLDPSGANAKVWQLRLQEMNDKDFRELMIKFKEDTNRFHLFIDVNPEVKEFLPYDVIEKTAKKHKVKLFEYVMFPHQNLIPSILMLHLPLCQ